MEQKMSNLPAFRLNPSCPFENSAIDYFGPFTMKYGHRSRTKAYGVVFTCLTTRAIHVELATDVSTDTFLLALRRFMSLYGAPNFVRSDNGGNFIGAANELRAMIKKWKETAERIKLVDICNLHSIRWTFSTPTASHHNGAVENIVKSVKLSLNKLLNNQVYNEEEYRTIFAEVTSIVNSRPLWPASEGDIFQPPITCNDLLKPRGLPRDPPEMNVSENPKKRYEHIQRVVNDWWKIWLLNFTPNLQCRSKWSKERRNVAVGDIVLIIDPTVRRSQWQMAIVEKVYQGDDGRVRSARVKTVSGSYDRPITEFCLIFTTGGYSISLIWNKSKVFLFDSHSRDNNGLFICNGTSVLLEFKSLSVVEKYIKTEYSKHISNFNKTQYDLQYIRVGHGSNNNVSSILNSINNS